MLGGHLIKGATAAGAHHKSEETRRSEGEWGTETNAFVFDAN